MTRYVALYCRISVDRAGRKEGVDAQERWGRKYAAERWPGLPVVVFKDNDLSAADDDVVRPDYERLKECIERREVAHVWAVEQYRIERREIAWFQLAQLLEECGITELHTNRDGVVRVRDEVAGIKAVLGAGEVRRIKKRVNDTLAEKAALGEPPGGTCFGYRRAKKDDGTKTLEIIPEYGEAARQAAEWLLTGWSQPHIAAKLAEMGIRGARGAKITARGVADFLTAPTIAGYRRYKGQIVTKGNWPPILDEQTWQACRVRLSQPRVVVGIDGEEHEITKGHGGYHGRRYLLTGGLAVCETCGARMSGTVLKRPNGKVRYLRCHKNAGGRGCTGIKMDNVDNYVLTTLLDALDNPEFLDSIAADVHSERRNKIVDTLAVLDKKRGEVAAAWADPDGGLTLTEWHSARAELVERERKLRTELAELPPPLINVDVTGARELWPDMTLDEQRAFLRTFIKQVTVRKSDPSRRRICDPETRVEIIWQRLT